MWYAQDPPLTSRYNIQVDPAGISSLGSIPVGAIVADGNGMGGACCREPPFYFCEPKPRVSLLVFLLVSAAIQDKNELKFKWLWH
jgi:hypothetical protein